MKYWAQMKYAPLSELLRQASINTDNQLMVSLIIAGKFVQTLAEVQEHILYFIKVCQLTMEHMFQVQLLYQVYKVSTM